MNPITTASCRIKNKDVVVDSSGKTIVMGRNVAIVVEDDQGNERALHKVTYGSRLFVDDGDKVKRGMRLVEWDPYTRPILTEVDGIIDFEDVVEGVSVNEVTEESTGITNRVDCRLAFKPARQPISNPL